MAEDKASIARLNLLHPLLRDEAIKLYREAVRITPVGVHPFIVQTLRTFEEQDALYQKGRTRPGPKVTNAKPGTSYHNYGLALDFCLQINGKLVWKVDANWLKVANVFKKAGWSWGGDWKSFKDYPHLEKTFNNHWRDLLAVRNKEHVDKKGYVMICT
jgi:peptidoglycan L-alanyl-D-glutamate endopeptidase CwlK